jgi:hypothetical protein
MARGFGSCKLLFTVFTLSSNPADAGMTTFHTRGYLQSEKLALDGPQAPSLLRGDA